MPTVDPIIADDALLLSLEPSTLVCATVVKDVSANSSTVVSAHVDHVFGSGYAGVFVAGPLVTSQRAFNALVVGANATVYSATGQLSDAGGVLSASSVVLTPLSGAWNIDFPHYLRMIATSSTVNATIDGQAWSTATGYAISRAGQILLRPAPATDITTAKLYTSRTFSGTALSFLPFPDGITPVTNGLGSSALWQSPERRLFSGTTVDRTAIVDDGGLSPLTLTEDQRLHAVVGAQFGDLEFDVGKSVPWTKMFVDDVYITDINSGDPRYYIIDWDKTSPESKYTSLGVDYFTSPAAWRKAQFEAADAAWGYDNNDWVLFLDATEGLSCDTRSLPDDVVFNPFRSYLHREVTRATTAGLSQVCLPFYAFVRNDPRPDARRFFQIEDTELLQTQVTLPTLDQANVSVVHVAAPYYLQPESFTERGLTRLLKVSVLRNPSFDWSQLDRFAQPSTGVKVQIISYAYAKWVNPANGTEAGLKVRQKISQVRPIASLPSSGIGDSAGIAGPYTVADQGLLAQVAGSTAQTEPLLTPLYRSLFRVNPADGVWYRSNVAAPETTPPPFAFAFPPPHAIVSAQNATVRVFE